MKINHKKHTDEKKNHEIRSAVKKKKNRYVPFKLQRTP